MDHSGAKPDIVTLGKAFGSGFPVSGVLTKTEIANTEPWSKPSGASSSYGGNPLAAAAALASVKTIKEEKLWDNAAAVGAKMLTAMQAMKEKYPFVGEVRGEGLFLALEIVKDRKTKEPVSSNVMKGVYAAGVKKGLLAMSYSPHIRLQPALNIDADTALEGLAILDAVFAELNQSGAWK